MSAAKAKPKVAPAPDEMAGITAADCCRACYDRPGQCTLTGDRFCGHPFKNSYPNATPAQSAKIERAKKMIGRQSLG